MIFNNIKLILFLLFFLFIFVLCQDQESNVNRFQSCNRYTSFGYGYRDFFEIKKGSVNPNEVFYLEFYVRTSSDAHILLKSTHGGEDTTLEGYEIVIGGGSNTFSQIRYLDGETKNTMITTKTEKYLSGIDYRLFWISIDNLGILSVGRDDEGFLNWRFDNVLPVKYFSFGSWTQVKADWRFGCKNQSISKTQDNLNISPLRKLKNDLFTLYDPNTLPLDPNQMMEVKVNFQIHQVALNEKRGEFTMHGSGELKWTDRKVRWKPENYGGIDTIFVPPFQIWTPSVRVLNTLIPDRTPLFDLTVSGVIVKSDGSVYWRPPFTSVSTCVLDLKYWPFDLHNCSVVFGFFMEPPNLVLTVMDEYKTLIGDRAGSEWEILEVMPFNSREDFIENYGILYVELKRLQGTQPLIYSVPYIVAIVMSLSSFWVSPLSSFKLQLSCGSVIILITILLLMGLNLPAMTASVPIIIQLYSWTVVASCIPIVLFCIIKNIQNTINLPQFISKFLNHGIVNAIFCLPELLGSEYCNLNDNENKIRRDRLDSLRLITIIERFFFLGYLIALILLQVFIK